MNMDDRITIIHGLNGFGKTTILRMMNGLFTSRYSELQDVSFQSFDVDLDNRRSLRVRHHVHEPGEHNHQPLDIRLYEGKRQSEEAKIREPDVRSLNFPIGMIDEAVPFLTRRSETTWLNLETGEELSLADVISRYAEFLPGRTKQQMPKWLRDVTGSVKVRFIESQRLLKVGRRPRRSQAWGPGGFEPAVAFYSEQVAREIQRKLAEYAERSQSLDQTFPMRLVGHLETGRPPEVSTSELESRLANLDEKRKRLREAGLLEKEEVPFQVPKTLQLPTQQVLPLYVHDVEEKLQVFDELLAKIELLKRILNEKFLFKSISITKERGFTFTSQSGEPLLPTHLSSGEQHMLVLLSELLFTVEPNSLVMIDEPEISLHVDWQQSFLRDLAKITELASFDILIATHSPQIINDRWDLTVALQSPSERRLEEPVNAR